MTEAVVSERHPPLMKLLRSESRAVVFNDERLAHPLGNRHVDPRRPGIPRIRDELGQCHIRRADDRSQRANAAPVGLMKTWSAAGPVFHQLAAAASRCSTGARCQSRRQDKDESGYLCAESKSENRIPPPAANWYAPADKNYSKPMTSNSVPVHSRSRCSSPGR